MAKTKGKEKSADSSVQPEVEEINDGAPNDANPVESTHEASASLISGGESTERNGYDGDNVDGALQGEISITNVPNVDILEKDTKNSKIAANKKSKTNRKKATPSAAKKGKPNTSVEANSSPAGGASPEDATILKDATEPGILTPTSKTSSEVAEEDNEGDDNIEKENQEAVAEDIKKEGAEEEKNEGNMQKKDSSGLIFMCNKKTMGDCFKYKVLGLPESKKDTVAKIYKGMRLFLYNTDLKLMYGIFKAATPGGYNIESEAFKSAFPSQVRFTVLKDCTPLPEEKFKPAIKANYYGRNKFNCKLSSEQVKNLCKSFLKGSKSKSSVALQNGTSKTGQTERGRKKGSSNVDGRKKGNSNVDGRKRHRSRSRSVDRSRKRRFPGTGQNFGRKPYIGGPPYQRATYPPPPLIQPTYAQERAISDYYYSRELPVEHYRREVPADHYRREVPVDQYRREVLVDHYPREIPADHYRREVPLSLDNYRRELPLDNPIPAVYREPATIYREPATIPDPYYAHPPTYREVHYPELVNAAAYNPSRGYGY